MTTGQKLLFALGVVLIIAAIALAWQTRPQPEPSFCEANKFPTMWGYDPAEDMKFQLQVLPSISADHACEITFTWPGGKITSGYVANDGVLYMKYAPDKPPRKHRIINNSRIAELNDDGTIANYKVKIM